MPQTLTYSIVDAFAHGPYTGNPAGIVLQADVLNERQMQTIAREINASETSFVTRPTGESAKMHIRWFTPAREVGFCGHATIGAAHALLESAEIEKFGAGSVDANSGGTKPHGGSTVSQHSNFRSDTGDHASRPVFGRSPALVQFESPAGLLRLRYEPLPADPRAGAAGWPDRDGLFWLNMPEPSLKPDNTNPLQTARLLGITVDDFEPGMPIMRTRDDDAIIMLRSWNTLVEMRPNFSELARWGDEHKLRGFCCATLHTLDKSTSVHSRFFAPSFGINEDPVTGSVHGPLATLLVAHELVPASNGKAALTCVQGVPGGRTGLVQVMVERATDAERPGYRVAIAGRCYTVMRGELRVPDKG